jgi:hypothetical protein
MSHEIKALLLVPVMYSIFVLDLKLIRWDEVPSRGAGAGGATATRGRTARHWSV